jgi:hypothetical protein
MPRAADGARGQLSRFSRRGLKNGVMGTSDPRKRLRDPNQLGKPICYAEFVISRPDDPGASRTGHRRCRHDLLLLPAGVGRNHMRFLPDFHRLTSNVIVIAPLAMIGICPRLPKIRKNSLGWR